MKFSFLVVVLLVVLVVVPFVSADLILSPASQSITTPYFIEYVGYVNLFNNGSESLYNVAFSPVEFFSFPVGINISANSSVNASFSVMTNSLFNNRGVVSTVSAFYKVPFTPLPIIYEINITSNGFQPSSITIKQNDSVKWNNLLSSDVQVRDLGSGFGQVNLPALGSQTVQYSSLKSQYSFYCSPQGFTGGLVVKERENFTLEHSSSFDRSLSVSLSSILQNSTMQVNQLSSSISLFPNETYQDVLLEIRNQDSGLFIQGINISSDSKWVSNFSVNDFNLQAGGIQRILFNISVLNITQTSQTNKTYNVVLVINSQNAGSTTKVIPVFVKYMMLDGIVNSGNQYNVTVLGINETIEFCLKNMNDVNFRCKDLERYFAKNITRIVEVPQSYRFSESTVASIQESAMQYGNVSVRLENLMNRYLDFQNSVNIRVNNNSMIMENLSNFIVASELERDERVSNMNVRFWIVFSLVFVLLLFRLVLFLVNNVRYYDALEEARQL